MGRYITWDSVHERYGDIEGVGDSQEVERAFLQPAEYELDARLSSRYTTPFESNNETAKDLSIDITYLKAMPTRNKNWERIDKYVDKRITMLLKGQMGMITTSGDLQASNKLVPFTTTSGSPQVFLNATSEQLIYGLGIQPNSGSGC